MSRDTVSSVAEDEEPRLTRVNGLTPTSVESAQREEARRLKQLRDDRKSLRYVPWLMLISITMVIVSALQAGSQDGSYKTPSLRKRSLLRRDSSCEETASDDSNEEYDQLQSTMLQNTKADGSESDEGEDEDDPDDAQPGSKSSSDTSSATATANSTATDDERGAEEPRSSSTSPSTSQEDDDEPSEATANTESTDPEEWEDGSGLCCDTQTCSTGEADGGLSVTSCGYEAAIEGYYCAYTCTMEGWSSVLLTDDGQQYASCSRVGGDGNDNDDDGDEEADNSDADNFGDEEEGNENRNNNNNNNDSSTFANDIITAGLESLADETYTADGDCTSYSGLTSACTSAEAGGDGDGDEDGYGSSTCTYACMSNADSSCSSAAGDGATGNCVVGASEGETPTASCSVSCTSESFTLGTDSTCSSYSSDDNAALRKRTTQRHSRRSSVPMPEPTANSWKHPKWLR